MTLERQGSVLQEGPVPIGALGAAPCGGTIVGMDPDLEPGGWSFEFENDNYPDIDDTAEIVIALRKVDHPDRGRVDAAIRRGVTAQANRFVAEL